MQSALVQAWGKLATIFRDEPTVAGYDLLNEPGFGETAPVTTSYLLGQYYDRAIAAIRSSGAPQIVFVEPSILWSGLGFDSGPTPGFTGDHNIVFSPHLYAESITMDRSLGIPAIVSLERQFTLAQRVADEYNAPLWSGEYGYWGDNSDVDARLTRYAKAEDANMLGSAYWVWKQACGDPQNGIGGDRQRNHGPGLQDRRRRTAAHRPAADPGSRVPALGARTCDDARRARVEHPAGRNRDEAWMRARRVGSGRGHARRAHHGDDERGDHGGARRVDRDGMRIRELHAHDARVARRRAPLRIRRWALGAGGGIGAERARSGRA